MLACEPSAQSIEYAKPAAFRLGIGSLALTVKVSGLAGHSRSRPGDRGRGFQAPDLGGGGHEDRGGVFVLDGNSDGVNADLRVGVTALDDELAGGGVIANRASLGTGVVAPGDRRGVVGERLGAARIGERWPGFGP